MIDVLKKIEAGIRYVHSALIVSEWNLKSHRRDSRAEVFLASGDNVPPTLRVGGIAPGSSVLGARIPEWVISQTHPVGAEFNRYNRCPSGAWIEFETASSNFIVELCESRQFVPSYMASTAAVGAELLCLDSNSMRVGFTAAKVSCSARSSLHVCSERASSSRRYRLLLPLFSIVSAVRIISRDGTPFELVSQNPAETGEFITRKNRKVAFYGSSVTQGCSAASVAGTIPNRVAALCGIEAYNFGFSSSAFGEKEIAAYLGDLKIDGLVIEYDHNASVEHLRQTHTSFYRIFREHNPTCPIVFVSRVSGGLSISEGEAATRRSIIEGTIGYARSCGDERVAYVNGDKVLPVAERWRYFADDRHPNQLGIERIAKAIAGTLYDALMGED